MEFPFAHHAHTQHHRRRDVDYPVDDQIEQNYPHPGITVSPGFGNPPPPRPPPQSYFGEDERPPHLTHTYHSSHGQPPPPPSQDFSGYSAFPSESPPPRPPPTYSTTYVEHLSHEVDRSETQTEPHHNYRPHFPSFLHHQTHQPPTSDLSNKRAFKVFSKADPNYSLTIRDGHVILAPSNPSDDFQHWYKDEKYSTRVKDEDGFPCFALVNKATGQAIKHSTGATHPVQLIPYNADALDESILWTESKDLGNGFRAIRMVNNIHLNVDAFHGDKKSGGVHNGTTIVLWQWNKGDNQNWKIIPYCKFFA
ncbi:ricin B-like lectin EULS3 isoform X1 [Carya illinoinensis]|nr:ricin B-like lectin EULS3 isoform X1 [Carya illinoinensis]